MLELKWPPIKRALITKLFIPYLIYLILFSIYTLNLRELKRDMIGNIYVTTFFYTIQVLIGIITLYFANNELT